MTQAFIMNGWVDSPLKLGKRAVIHYKKHSLLTSQVVKIIYQNEYLVTFQTKNSIYTAATQKPKNLAS